MLPTLLPTAPDLVRAGLIGGVALLTIGLGLLLGARRLETGFMAGWGAAALVMVTVGTRTTLPLSGVLPALGAAGVAGWFRLPALLRRRPGNEDPWPLARVMLLGSPFLLLVLGLRETAWDSFAQWVPNLLYLCRHAHFPTRLVPDALSPRAGYPYALTLPGYALYLLGYRDVINVAPVWNLIATLTAGSGLARLLVRVSPPGDRSRWSAAAIGALASGIAGPAFIPKIVLSNLADGPTAAAFGLLVLVVFDLFEPDRRDQRVRALIEFAMIGALLVFLRQANAALMVILAFGIAVAIVTAWRTGERPPAVGLILALLPAALVWYLWSSYVAAQLPGGRFVLLPPGAWHWPQFPDTAWHMLVVLSHKIGFTAVALALAARCSFVLVRPTAARAPERALVIVASALLFGNMAFLLFAYLAADFTLPEVAAAASAWRYLSQAGLAATIALIIAVLPRRWLSWGMSEWRVPALTAAALLAPVFAFPTYRTDLRNPVPRLRMIADRLHQALPPGVPVALVDPAGDGFAPMVVSFELRAILRDRRPTVTIAAVFGLRPQGLRTALVGAPRDVWLAQGAPGLAGVFGVPTSAGCSYLLQGRPGTYRILRAWAIGPYRWSTHIYDESLPAKPNCQGRRVRPIRAPSVRAGAGLRPGEGSVQQ